MQLVPMPGMAAAHAWHQQLPRGDGSLPGISPASWQHPGVLLPAPLGTASMGVWCPGDCILLLCSPALCKPRGEVEVPGAVLSCPAVRGSSW